MKELVSFTISVKVPSAIMCINPQIKNNCSITTTRNVLFRSQNKFIIILRHKKHAPLQHTKSRIYCNFTNVCFQVLTAMRPKQHQIQTHGSIIVPLTINELSNKTTKRKFNRYHNTWIYHHHHPRISLHQINISCLRKSPAAYRNQQGHQHLLLHARC